jgi:hypothetical protein
LQAGSAPALVKYLGGVDAVDAASKRHSHMSEGRVQDVGPVPWRVHPAVVVVDSPPTGRARAVRILCSNAAAAAPHAVRSGPDAVSWR